MNSNEMLHLGSTLNFGMPPEIKDFPEVLFVKIPEPHALKSELRTFIRYFSGFKMCQSAKWCSELLFSLIQPQREASSPAASQFVSKNTDKSYQSHGPLRIVSQIEKGNMEQGQSQGLGGETEDLLLLLNDLFDCGDFKKCAYFAQKELKRLEILKEE